MRFIAPFLAFIVVFLSLVPCSDETMAYDKAGHETHSTSHDHSKDPTEGCTPFCTCNCCSTNIIFSPETIFISIVSEFFLQNLFFYQESKSSFSHSIWQPPKI